MAHYHPPKEWLLDYVAGKVNEGFRLVLGAHIEDCSECRHQLHQLQTVGAGLLSTLAPSELASGAFARVWQRAQQLSPLADAPAQAFSVRTGLQKRWRDLKWQQWGPVKRADVLLMNDCHVSLLHIKAGARMPRHTHQGNEMTLILSGAYSDVYGRYDRGDVIVADGEQEHAPVASSDEDCICLVAESAPLRFTSPLMKLFNPLLRWR